MERDINLDYGTNTWQIGDTGADIKKVGSLGLIIEINGIGRYVDGRLIDKREIDI